MFDSEVEAFRKQFANELNNFSGETSLTMEIFYGEREIEGYVAILSDGRYLDFISGQQKQLPIGSSAKIHNITIHRDEKGIYASNKSLGRIETSYLISVDHIDKIDL